MCRVTPCEGIGNGPRGVADNCQVNFDIFRALRLFPQISPDGSLYVSPAATAGTFTDQYESVPGGGGRHWPLFVETRRKGSEERTEHKKGKRPSTHDKHTKQRSGRTDTKQRTKKGWFQR